MPVFAPRIRELLSQERVMELGRGRPNLDARPTLARLSVTNILDGSLPADPAAAQGLISALWLYHDFLDESHTISQSIATPSGSYLHGVMHRREGDFENAKYWFRQVVDHDVFPALRDEAALIAGQADLEASAVYLGTQRSWDPFRFVDLVRSVVGTGSRTEEACRTIQAVEWKLLFEFLFGQATGDT